MNTETYEIPEDTRKHHVLHKTWLFDSGLGRDLAVILYEFRELGGIVEG